MKEWFSKETIKKIGIDKMMLFLLVGILLIVICIPTSKTGNASENKTGSDQTEVISAQDQTYINYQEEQLQVNQMLVLTQNMEKEALCEQQLGAKGFQDSIVSISNDSVDVTIGKIELTDVEKAQIEDIITRKAECDVSKVVITTIKNEN